MNDVIKKIEQALREYDSTIKFSGSSALTDLMINPLASIISPYQRDVNKLTREQSLIDPESISELEMDRYAANHYISRNAGARATGYIRIYFRSPRTLYLAPGTYFETNDGKRFNLNAAYSITESQMATNVTDYPNVATGLIPVTAANYGVENEAGPNTVTKVVGLNSDYAYVKNPVAITGGTSRETNTQLKSRIESAIINKSISSDRGIQSVLMTNFTTITDVVVKGAGDDEMARDLVYVTPSGEQLSNLPSNFYRSDFFGALSGLQSAPANMSRGYWGTFYVEVPAGDTITVDEIPDSSNFTHEWTTSEYTSLYKINDSRHQTITTDHILQETFAEGEADNDTWVMSDGSTIDSALIDLQEIGVESGFIRLGKTFGTERTGNPIPPQDVRALLDIIDGLGEAGRTDNTPD